MDLMRTINESAEKAAREMEKLYKAINTGEDYSEAEKALADVLGKEQARLCRLHALDSKAEADARKAK